MKKIWMLLLLSCFFCSTIHAQDRPIIRFINKDSVYDFGLIHAGHEPKYEFEIKNAGNAKLIITGMTSDNSNLKFEWPDKPVKVGKKTRIYVTYSTKDSTTTGSFTNNVLIISNATEQPYPFIHIKGAVIPSKGAPVSDHSHDNFPIEPGYERYNGDH